MCFYAASVSWAALLFFCLFVRFVRNVRSWDKIICLFGIAIVFVCSGSAVCFTMSCYHCYSAPLHMGVQNQQLIIVTGLGNRIQARLSDSFYLELVGVQCYSVSVSRTALLFFCLFVRFVCNVRSYSMLPCGFSKPG